MHGGAERAAGAGTRGVGEGGCHAGVLRSTRWLGAHGNIPLQRSGASLNRPGMSGDLELRRVIAAHHSPSLSAIIHGAVVFDYSTETRTETSRLRPHPLRKLAPSLARWKFLDKGKWYDLRYYVSLCVGTRNPTTTRVLRPSRLRPAGRPSRHPSGSTRVSRTLPSRSWDPAGVVMMPSRRTRACRTTSATVSLEAAGYGQESSVQ